MPNENPSGHGFKLRVRMYRQGLGDCFLLSVQRPAPARAFHILIDCGVILGTPNAADRLRTVVSSVIEETNGFVDVLVVTHEHYDHVAAFVLAKDMFATPEQAGAKGKLTVGEVWFAWTENPAEPLATELRGERRSQLAALAAMGNQLAASGLAEADAHSLSAALNHFGVARNGSGLGDTAQAMVNAARLVGPDRVHYHRPGALLTPQAAPELRFYVLGPPMDRASLKRTDSTSEVYHLDADNLEAAVRVAVGDYLGTGDSGSLPFDPSWALSLSGMAAGEDAGPHGPFFHAHYFGEHTKPNPDISWRRIDGAWLASSEALALALDSATNNTSLALAVELVGSGKVLLFPADAQVGNWLSWEALSWTGDHGKVTAADLLSRTVFYKVGHHGSHNATLRAKGLELMPSKDLAAFIPVDHEMAVKKGWGQMPLPALVEALKDRCGDHLVRIDEDLPAPPAGVSQGGTGVQYGSLYYDWTSDP